ncbi:uncharacterized protein PHACADRAFT_214223 [Phanerochaete carnosa HHB-10118-sp]|uniref:F-box domain-containing protein n=1 Tax=Phanerochaete carnosa (strain HHB-10118-sp) TaxID=650164 RepID=K5UJG5_PHACS|nr:uncharacterized protein PHACADRAFT_214223 [Phanerochaete carnosa HHB-10118-sp]EKM49706.1 hypothetical protein PHACADRAFT_214223 [Phanerochaete carnosa HHB-10118-sp]
MKLIDHIPEELTREILRHCLIIPEDEFYDDHLREIRRVKRKHGEPPASCILLVCKKWRQIGEWALYTSLCIASAEHARAVAQVLKLRAPVFARFIEHVRLEAGYGIEIQDILKFATNLKTIFVSAMVSSSESIKGLQRALPTVSPVRLYVHTFGANDEKNANKKTIENMLETMEEVHFYPHTTHLNDTMVLALMSASPSVKTISFDGYTLLHRYVKNSLSLEMIFARNTNIKRIICRRSVYYKSNLQYSRMSKMVLGVLDYQ